MKFKNYLQLKDRKELLDFIKKEKIELSEDSINSLLKEGNWRKALLATTAGVTLASPFVLTSLQNTKDVEKPTASQAEDINQKIERFKRMSPEEKKLAFKSMTPEERKRAIEVINHELKIKHNNWERFKQDPR